MVVKANPPLSDLVELLWVSNDDLDTHFQLGLLQAEVQAGNFGIDNPFRHFYVESKRHIKISSNIYQALCESTWLYYIQLSSQKEIKQEVTNY